MIATIILARGGSKRFPGKIVHHFHGRPLIEWTIADAVSLGYPVYLYTDNEQVRKICERYPKINVREKLFENEEGFHKTKEELIEYNKEIKASWIIILQATSPMRSTFKMQEWIDRFLESHCDVGFSARCLREAFYYDSYGNELNYKIDERNYNSHGVGMIWRETGSFYIFTSEQINRTHFMDGRRIIFDDPFDIDINTLEDLKEAECRTAG
jgi:CMP-N-acetylneuraminic acid synthetase